MIYLKSILATGDQITKHLLNAGESTLDAYKKIGNSSMHFDALLNRIALVNASDDMHALMRNLSISSKFLSSEVLEMCLNFLFSRLTVNQEDIRIHAAMLMGEMIAKIEDKKIKKAYHTSYLALFFKEIVGEHEQIKIWRKQLTIYYIHGFKSVDKNAGILVDGILDIVHTHADHVEDINYICQVFREIADLKLSVDQFSTLSTIIDLMSNARSISQAITINYTNSVLGLPLIDYGKIELLAVYKSAYDYLIHGNSLADNSIDINSIYLSNLKTATPSIVKQIHIEILIKNLEASPDMSFYTAMHFSNMLKVSADHQVRSSVASALTASFDYLTDGERNDIVFELIKSLEVENYQHTQFIPQYLGILITKLSENEINEIMDRFEYIIKTSRNSSAKHILDTVATLAIHLEYQHPKETYERVIHIILIGLSHFECKIRKNALKAVAMCFAAPLAYHAHSKLYELLAKKMCVFFATHQNIGNMELYSMPVQYNLYTLIHQYTQQNKPLLLKTIDKVAFFPGSFDPFSLAHLQIATRIRDMGFEVYLAIDEFSWSKRTQPNNIRRKIVELATFSEQNIYIYPQNQIVNIANPKDLIRLKQNFNPRNVHLVMGEDVLNGASAYRKSATRDLLLSFSHILFSRMSVVKHDADSIKLEDTIKTIKGDVVRLELSNTEKLISSTQIRRSIDQNREISNLVDPLVELYIYDKMLYRAEPQYKETMRADSTKLEVITDITEAHIDEIIQFFPCAEDSLKTLLFDNARDIDYRLLKISCLENGEIIAFSIFHWLRSSMTYQLFGSELVSQYIHEHAGGRIVAIRMMQYKEQQHIKKIKQVIITETLAYNLAKDYHYAVYFNADKAKDTTLTKALTYQGFKQLPVDACTVYAVDMHRPITLNFDIKGMIKAPIRDHPLVDEAIDSARRRIQLALTKFFPGELVLAIDRTMIYEHLIKNICQVNNVPTIELEKRVLGNNMLVTYGDLFQRWRIPNTVTKALHTERFYAPDIADYTIANHPDYLPLTTQIATIESFNRPIILLDDILDKGKRLDCIAGELLSQNAQIKALIVAILTGRGKAMMEKQGIETASAYYIPNIRLWFNESMLYPFIGGDAVDTSPSNNSALFSINKIMPYVMPDFVVRSLSKKIFEEFSLACLQSALEVMLSLEKTYLNNTGKTLSLQNLGEVFISPRLPYLDKERLYDQAKKPSDYIKADIALLKRVSY